MKYADKVFKRSFVNDSSKGAYLHACKWVATHLLSKSSPINPEDILWRIKRDENSNSTNTFILEVYIVLEESDVKADHCRICKEVHSSFYLNNSHSCDNCKQASYIKRKEQRLAVKKEFIRKKIAERLEAN